MQVTMLIYSNKLPATELELFRCIKCTRPLFKANSSQILISNAYGASFRNLPANTNYQEHQCHSCKTEYNILWQ